MIDKADDYHHGDLRNSLLRAVEEIILEKSVAELSLREAARRAGVSHSAPAHHFGDKNGMLAAFAEEGFADLAAEMQKAAALAESPDAHGQMDGIGMAYVMFAVEHPAHFDVMFRSGLHNDATPELEAAADAAFSTLYAKTEAVIESGEFPPDMNPAHLAAYFWSVVHGIASLWVDGSLSHYMEGMSIEEVVQGVFSIPDKMPRQDG